MKNEFDSQTLPSGMVSGWQSAEKFYAARDNRTKLEVENLGKYAVKPIEILLDPFHSNQKNLQEIILLLCNLTARWARNIVVRLSEDVELNPNLKRRGFHSLSERISFEMKSADPFGKFLITGYRKENEFNAVDPLRIFVGPWSGTSFSKFPANSDDYFIDASGWSVFGRRGSGFDSCLEEATAVPATALAASLGAADLFKRAVGHGREEWIPDIFSWNVWDNEFNNIEFAAVCSRNKKNYYPVSKSFDIGRTLLAGVGAIGSALVYLLDFMTLAGEITFLDRDQVELSNLNRSPLFDVAQALNNQEKTEIAAEYLNRHALTINAKNGTWLEHGDELAQSPFDQWISLTNEDGAWATVPYMLPPVVFHGTTTSGWGFGSGRHLPRREDCTLCRMPRPKTRFRGICAQGEISNGNAVSVKATASLPFLSVASSALLLAEMLKISAALYHPQYTESIANGTNEVAVDLRYGLFAVTSLKRLVNESCSGCRISRIPKWLELGGRSRYRFLSDSEKNPDLKAA